MPKSRFVLYATCANARPDPINISNRFVAQAALERRLMLAKDDFLDR